MARPRKIKYPIGLEDRLRLAFPKKRIEDRFKFYRMEMRDHLIHQLQRKPTNEEIEQAIIKEREDRYDYERTQNFVFVMRLHHGAFARELKRNKAIKMAKARWSKKNEKTS